MPFEDEIPPSGYWATPPAEVEALARRVIGVAIEVHRALGPGLPEDAYEKALAMEFDAAGIRYERQYAIDVLYKGVPVARVRMDFLVGRSLVLELKSVDALGPIDRKQVLRYLDVMRLPLGLLINFNVPVLREGIRRVIRSEQPS